MGKHLPPVIYVVFIAHLKLQYLVSLSRRLNEEEELMKKRTLVCFLIFTLCVFHFSITDTVFGQEATPQQLADQVYDEFSSTLTDNAVISGDVTVQDVIVGILTVLTSPTVLENPIVAQLGGVTGALDLVLTTPTLLNTLWGQIPQAELAKLPTSDVNDYIKLLGMASVQTMLKNATVLTLIQNSEAVKLLLVKIESTGDGTTDPGDGDGTTDPGDGDGTTDPGDGDGQEPEPKPPTISITTPSPTTDQSGSFNVAFTTADVNGDAVTVTGSISVVPADAASYYNIPSGALTGSVRITQTAPTTAMPTILGATVTLTLVANDGTADSSPATIGITFATVEKPTPPPVTPPGDRTEVSDNPLKGQSKLGGLSLNRVNARKFIQDLIVAAGIPRDTADAQVETVVDIILDMVPKGFLPKKEIKWLIKNNVNTSFFENEKAVAQLDFENFGNAVMPALTELLYIEGGDRGTKYLASDNLNVYVRVFSTLMDGTESGSVDFNILEGMGTVGEVKRITPKIFQQDTINYTFNLEETLAATNLPAWPDLGNQLFSGVVLRYSQEGLDGEYIALDMNPVHEAEGVVWKGDVGIIPGRNVYYYFEVTLNEPVRLELINAAALSAALLSEDGTHSEDVVNVYPEITNWAMPDPRNLQLNNRGIFQELFTTDVTSEIVPIAAKVLAGQQIARKDLFKLQNRLLRNVNKLFNEFEQTFDPKLVSVFTVPAVDIETESLWAVNISSIQDGDVTLEAVVRNANGDAVDSIVVDFKADDSAPAATLDIDTADAKTTGYENKDEVFVTTAQEEGESAFPVLLNISSTLKPGDVLGPDEAYLIYQIIELDADGNPESTWLPLTVENSMLASDLWDLAREQLKDHPDPIVSTAAALPLDQFLGTLSALLTPTAITGAANTNPTVKAVLQFLGIEQPTEAQTQLLRDLIGAAVADLDSIPLTYDASRAMTRPLFYREGDYGIRAMGIDNLFNVGSYVPPTRVRVVMPEWDRTSVTAASLGDINHNGKPDSYESGTIFKNATDVTLTVAVNERTVHPGTIMVQYMDADGNWQNIGDPLVLNEAADPTGTIYTVSWSVTDFGALVKAGDTVQVRTVTINGLQLRDESEPFVINLDDDVHPVDPKVLVVDFNDDSIVMTNPDSGAPQGTIELIGYTPRRTVPATANIRIEAKRANDDAWADIGTAELSDPAGMSGTDTAAITFNGKALKDVYVDDDLHIQDSGSYLKWVITVDTTALADSIEMDNLAAAHANSNPDGTSYADLDTNRYMVRAYAIGDDGSDISDAVEGEDYTDTFSVDNVDDVAPLGQNMIAVAQDGVDVTANEDGSFNVGGLVDKYDPEVDSPVITLTITPQAKRDTYDSVELHTSLPDGAFMGEVTETAEGSGVYTVMVDIGTLMDADEHVHNDRYLEDWAIENPDEFVYNPKGKVFSFTAYALTEDAAGNVQDKDNILNADLSTTTAHEITLNVQNTYRPDPGVLAITVENSDGMTNADSGAPKYELTFNAYTYGLTSPPTEGVRFEVKRPGDETWERIPGTDEPPKEIDGSDLAGIVTGLVQITEHNTVSDGESEFAIPGSFHKWSVKVDTRVLARLGEDRPDDTITLDDTIKRGDAAERDASLDDNQYRVRAISLTPKNKAHSEYHQRDGVDAHFSLDNVDDVPPLGPTLITQVSDVAGTLAESEDGIYPEVVTVGGIVDPGVPSPVAIFKIKPIAEKRTYQGGQIRLVQENPDGNKIELPAVDVTDEEIKVDVGLLPDGIYKYYALVSDDVNADDPATPDVDESGNWQVQGEGGWDSPTVQVRVVNISVRDVYVDNELFRKSNITGLEVTHVDDEPVEGELPETIPLRDSISVSFNVNNGSLMVEDLTGVVVEVEDLTGVVVDRHRVMYTAGSDAENSFSLMADELGNVDDGWYTPHGEVTKRNGSVTFPLAMINLDNTSPMVEFVTPGEGDTVNDLPTLQATYNDGDLGVGISADNTAVVSLARLRPNSETQEEMPIDVDQAMVEQDGDSVVYTRIDRLAGGAYKFSVQVSDSLGNLGNDSVAFAVEGINPTVVITAPASGQQFDASPDSITGFYTGGGEVNITKFMVNDADVTADVDGNNFTYMPDGGFSEGDHNVSVQVTDGSGLTSETSLTFTITLPVPTVAILSPEPTQVYSHGTPIITGEFTGADTVIVDLSIDGMAVEAEISGNQYSYTPDEELSHGEHTVAVEVTDGNGKTAKTSTIFKVDIPGPSVGIISPAAGQEYDHGAPEILLDYSGVAEPVVLELTIDGEAVEMAEGAMSYTPDPALGDGEHTLMATVTDANGKTDEATVVFNVNIPGPSVGIVSPAAGQVYDHGAPEILLDYSGVAEPVVLELTIDGEAVEMAEGAMSYTPDPALGDGEYTLMATVTDANGKTDEATVVFTVGIPGPSVGIVSPAAGQVYDHGAPEILLDYSGVAEPVVLELTIDGEAVEMAEGAMSYTPDPALGDGEYTLMATVTDANGKTDEATVVFNVGIPGPTVALHAPGDGQTYNMRGTTISGEFTGVEPVTVRLTVNGRRTSPRIDGNRFTGSTSLNDGVHTVIVEVTDANGKTAKASSSFTVKLPDVTVSINTPAAGHTYDNGKPVISGEVSGYGRISVRSFTIDGKAHPAPPIVGNQFTYTPDASLGEGEHTVAITVRDGNGKTAQTSTVFNVSYPIPTVEIISPAAGQMYDHGAPEILLDYSGVAEPVVLELTIDGEAVEMAEGAMSYTPDPALGDGEHTLTATVTDANGKTDEATVVFSVVIPGPTVAIHSPASGQLFDHGKPMLQGEFSGVEASVAVTVNGAAIPVIVEGNEFTFTPPVRIDDGEYTVEAIATDANGKTAKATVVFSVSLPVPTVSILTPTAGQILDHGKPVISGSFSGADEIVVAATIDGNAVEVSVNENNEFTYTPSEALSHGEHTIAVEVTDGNERTANTSSVFTVDIPGPTVSINSPASGQLFDHGKPMLQGEFSGVDPKLTVTVNGDEIEVEVDGNEFTFTPADRIDDGEYTVVADVVDANGKTAKATAVFTVRLPVPTVTINSPAAGLTFNNGNPVVAGEFTGVAPVEVKLSIDGKDAEVKVDGNQFTHDLAEALSDGDHTISVEITDANDKTAQATTTFTIDIPGPSVSILSPASGQTYDHGAPVIRAEFEGSTDVDVTTFTINGEDAEGEVKDNQLAYTPDPVLGDGEHTVVVVVTDANKKTAEASVVFSVMRDKTAPIISAYAPIGVVRLNKVDVAEENMGVTITADISDPESDLLSVKYLIDGNAPTQSYPVDHAANKFEITRSFTPGTHSITLIVESEGGIKEFSWKFTLEVDEAPPTISNITPSGTVLAGLPTISASATDDTGVEEMSITLMDSKGKEVKGKASDDSEDRANEGITRLDFNPDAPLEEGTYTINVRATDGYGNSSTAKGGFTVTFDTAAPIITMASPQNGSRLTYKHDEERKPNISIAYADAGTGINVDSIRFVLNDQLINLTSKQKSASQVNYTPPADLEPGKYVVKLEVSDNAHQQGNVSEKNKGAREANTSVYEFSFFVERGDTPIMWAAPFNYPNPFSKNTRISLVLARRANVSITIFDATLRPVRVLVDNEVMDAGNYTKNPAGAGTNAFGWDGKSSSGEDLARGIYFCQIEVNDGIEPEFAILKLALTR